MVVSSEEVSDVIIHALEDPSIRTASLLTEHLTTTLRDKEVYRFFLLFDLVQVVVFCRARKKNRKRRTMRIRMGIIVYRTLSPLVVDVVDFPWPVASMA